MTGDRRQETAGGDNPDSCNLFPDPCRKATCRAGHRITRTGRGKGVRHCPSPSCQPGETPCVTPFPSRRPLPRARPRRRSPTRRHVRPRVGVPSLHLLPSVPHRSMHLAQSGLPHRYSSRKGESPARPSRARGAPAAPSRHAAPIQALRRHLVPRHAKSPRPLRS